MLSPRPRFEEAVNVGDPSIRITSYHSWAQLEQRIPAWEDILDTNPALSIFSSPEWLGSWWKAFGSNRQMIALAFSNERNELVGLAPLYLAHVRCPLLGRLKSLRFVGDGSEDSDNLDFIVKPGYEHACAAALLEWIGTRSGWHICELNTLPSDSTVASLLLQVLKSCRWTFTVSERPRLTIDLPDTWDMYLARLSNKERSKVRYYSRRLARMYKVCFFRCASPEDLSPCLEALFELHQKRWQLRSEQGTFASAARRRFYYLMGCSFLERKWLELWLLELNGKPVAAQFGFRYRDTVYSLQEGFDPDHATDAVGYVLRSYVLEKLISQGVRRYDFLAGRNSSKERWATRSGAYLDMHFAKPRTRGSAYLTVVEQARTAKEWCHKRLPLWAWNLLRALNRGRGLRVRGLFVGYDIASTTLSRLGRQLYRAKSLVVRPKLIGEARRRAVDTEKPSLAIGTVGTDSDLTIEGPPRIKILQIGNYPPPVCGWAIQTKLLVADIRRRGYVCDVLNLNESRRRKSNEYIDVQNGFDYLYKLILFALKGYRFQVHVNGQSATGYILALIAAFVGWFGGRRVALSWRGGLQQRYFPRLEDRWIRWAFQLLFRLSGQISCNNVVVKQAIERYGVDPGRVVAIPGFSRQHLDFQQVPLAPEVETFLKTHHPVFFCYVSFRPEYRLPMLREAMLQFRQRYPKAGFIWLGFPSKELPAAHEFVGKWPAHERQSLLLLGNLTHNEFLTLLPRCSACIRTPTCDGVSASVLESLALGVPVVASQNNHRPRNVTTYREGDAADLCAKLISVTEERRRAIEQTRLDDCEDNIAQTVDWLLGTPASQAEPRRSLVHVG